MDVMKYLSKTSKWGDRSLAGSRAHEEVRYAVEERRLYYKPSSENDISGRGPLQNMVIRSFPVPGDSVFPRATCTTVEWTSG